MSDVVAGIAPVVARPFRRARNGALIAGAVLWVLILVLCFAGGTLWPVDPYALDPQHALVGPGWHRPLGTDELGRDMLSRLISGGRATLLVAIPATALAFGIGAGYGLLSGLGPAWLDRVLMRLLDAILALPTLIVLISFAAILPVLDTANLILLIGAVAWPGLARLVRNETIAQRQRDFVLAARQLGGGNVYIARTHLLRIMGPLLVVNATFLLGDSILVLSALSFLGLGVQPPQTSWGQLLQAGLTLIDLAPLWLILPPGLMIFASLLAASLLGQGLLARSRTR